MKRFVVALTLIFWAQSLRLASEEVPPWPVADRILDTIDFVYEHHIDPPTRQELLAAAVMELYGSNGTAENLAEKLSAISREISDLSRDEFRLYLEKVRDWPSRAYRNDGEPDYAVLRAASRQAWLEGAHNTHLRIGSNQADDDDEVSRQMQENRYVGIGIRFTVASAHNDGARYPLALSVFPRGPAYAAGMRDGDLLLSIDGDSMEDVEITEFIPRLRGQEGKPVTIEVCQPDETETRTLRFKRGVVPRVVIKGWEELDYGQWDHRVSDEIAYAQFLEIGSSTMHDLKAVEASLSGMEEALLVLDLRHVTQANRHHTVLLADSLLDGGEIGTVATLKGVRTYHADRDCLFRGWTLAVIIDENVSGLTEWLAASLKTNRDAIIAGTRSAGYPYEREPVTLPVVLGQKVVPMETARLLVKLPTSMRRQPFTRQTQFYGMRGVGVRPDTHLFGENPDPSDEKAIFWIDVIIEKRARSLGRTIPHPFLPESLPAPALLLESLPRRLGSER